VEDIRINQSRVEWREVEGEIVALDLKASEYFTLNPTGTVLWGVLIEGATRAQLVEALIKRYGVSEQTATTDVGEFLDSLEKRGLIARTED
jgi:hypothetical protein